MTSFCVYLDTCWIVRKPADCSKFRDTYSYAFNPDILGADLTLNSFTPQDGHFRFAVQAQPNDVTIEVKSSSALPVKLLAAEFESMMIPRSRRYGA